ncbi:MAG TPA: MMPL family transporter [Candidatus Binataceae bacterium]|nr:MMPL family transporter [Candidatus Binataceae bacterium]
MSLRTRIFRALAQFSIRRPYLVLLCAAALAVASVMYTKAHLEFRTGQDDLITPNSRASRDYLDYTHEFPDLDGLIIVVRAAPDPARAEHFADTLAARLNADRANVKAVFYKIDAGAFADRAMLYMKSADLDALAQKLRAAFPMLGGYAADPSLAGFFTMVNAGIDRQMRDQMQARGRKPASMRRTGRPTSGTAVAANPRAVPDASAAAKSPGAFDTGAIDTVLGGMLAQTSGARYVSPWRSMMQAGGPDSAQGHGYLVSDNGKYLLLQVAPGDGVKDGPDPTEVIQRELNAVRALFPGVMAGMTGGPALAHAEETTTARDIALASLIAIVSNVLLLVIPFTAVVEPFFAVLALLVGVAWSFGFTTLAIGHLNLLSAVFTSVLAGIGINFPIHLMARYDEARRQGSTSTQAVELAVVNTGTGVFASACIMALAFLTPVFTDFRGIAELGIVSAAGLFLCLVSALLVFPSLIVLRDRYRPTRTRPQLAPQARASILEAAFRRPALIVVGAVALTVCALMLTGRVRFDQNLLKLQAERTEAVKIENLLLKDSGRSSWFAVSLAPSMEAGETRAAAFRKLPEVSDVETISTYIPDDQAAKLKTLHALSAMLAPIEMEPLRHRDGSPRLARELGQLADRLTMMAPADPSGAAAKTAALAKAALDRLKRDPTAFASYEASTNADLRERLVELKHDLNPAAVTVANLPKIVRDRFIGKSGRFLVQIYPRGDVWEDAALSRFIGALKTVDEDVTGPPVQTYNIATVMRRGYEHAAVLALIAVFVFVFADFRNLRDTALATVPLLFGGAWMLEAMGWMGWEFNLANLFAVPILIGTGIDNGVNMLYRWREERDKSALILTKAVGKSVTICSLTTIAGFAALISAEHRGISSLGWVLSLGVTLILVATLVVLPALFELVGGRIESRRTEPPAPELAPEEEPRVPPKTASGGLRG